MKRWLSPRQDSINGSGPKDSLGCSNGSNAAVLQGVNVPTRFTDWPFASGNASFGCQPAKIFHGEIPTTAEAAKQCSDPEEKQAEHGTELYQIRGEDIAVSY